MYNIPPELPFVDALVTGIKEICLKGNFELTDFTILVPTRRSVISLQESFFRLNNRNSLLLPRISPIGDLDEEEIMINDLNHNNPEPNYTNILDIPDAISDLHRQLMLTKHIQSLKGDTMNIDQAAKLARELGKFLDQVQTEEINFAKLNTIVPEELAEHWQVTLLFLEILSDFWPSILKDNNLIDPARRRNLLINSQIEYWTKNPPQKPIIAAGSTGTIPATSKLLRFISLLKEGAVVLPGLDTTLDDTALEDMDTHPQSGMYRLLSKLGLKAQDVTNWLNPESVSNLECASVSRRKLIFNAMLPAAKVGRWRSLGKLPKGVLDNVEIVNCPSLEEEAKIIALKLRQSIETSGKIAALVTPDRFLARRVSIELDRWNIKINDSAGIPISQTLEGSFLRLACQLIESRFSPISLLSLGKNPLTACSMPQVKFRELIRDLEINFLRGPRPAPGIEGLIDLVKLTRPDLKEFLETIKVISQDFTNTRTVKNVSLAELVRAHIRLAEALATSDTTSGAERLWSSETGEGVANFIKQLIEVADTLNLSDGRSYSSLFDTLLIGQVARTSDGSHPRLYIWGLLEARLQKADLLILGGLNEGTWPPDIKPDPWMSRPMRKEFGLPPLDQRIALTAHDFQQAMCAPEVFITRANKVDGTPTIPSRCLVRLEKIVNALGDSTLQNSSSEESWLYWQQMLDDPDIDPCPIKPPAPTPPISARPRQLSVTQIETWMRDPYAIYAKHILKLEPLPSIDAPPDAADYGSIIHKILDLFVKKYSRDPVNYTLDNILKIGQEEFSEVLKYPSVWAFWWPRFLRIAEWFINNEKKNLGEIITSHNEVIGKLIIKGRKEPFVIVAKADRIDKKKDGGLMIIDYKTGALPSRLEVLGGFAPQLPLEAAIAESGGFDGISENYVQDLLYWRLKGGNPAGEILAIKDNPKDLAISAKEGLEALVRLFDQKETPYESRPRPDTAPAYSDYEHLARVKEWSSPESK